MNEDAYLALRAAARPSLPHAWIRSVPTFRVGERIRLLDELGGSAVTIKGLYAAPDMWQVELPSGKNICVSSHALRRSMAWKPGDVVIVRYSGPSSLPYTYVRGALGWPGENRAAKTDAQITDLYFSGKAKPVLQAGGEPFASARLA